MKKTLLTLVLLLVLSVPIYATEVDIGVEAVIGTGIVKPNIGIDINKIYAGFVIETTRSGLFATIGLGGVIKMTSKDLGSTLLFRASVGVGYRFGRHRMSVIFDHISNADFASYNPGLDVFGIRYGYNF